MALAVGVALAGCAPLGVPAASEPTSTSQSARSKVAEAQATHEYPSPEPARQTADGGAASPAAAIRAFASTYINWTALTVADHLRALAVQSVGQARSAMALAAAETAHDYELQRGGIANSGTIEAVAPLLGRTDEYVVVTRELTTASNSTAYEGLVPAWHLAIATVVQLSPGVWVVSGWQPES
jgi:hypothetical protein